MEAKRIESSILLSGAAIAIALLAPFFLYFDTAHSIVSIWNKSETFTHGYIILPISLWLIWSRRDKFAHLSPQPYWPALLLLAATGFGWLLADLGDVQVVKQYAFVAMLPIIAVAILGIRIAWTIAFPLLFLLLAVPFGEIFIDPLIHFTADFTVAAVQATGIPVLREGNNFSLPTGNWSVVEACSGVRYLISSFTLGCLYAYLTYRSRVRQTVFIVLSIIVPIIANGLRAYMIVMIGHFSGMALATGADHLVYGWVFFGIIMFIMFWIGSFWREDQSSKDLQSNANAKPTVANKIPVKPKSLVSAAIAIVACISLWPLYAKYIERAAHNPAQANLTSFTGQWQETPPFTNWKPRFYTANSESYRYFEQNGKPVGLAIKYYRNQQPDSLLISSINQVISEKDRTWRKLDASIRVENIDGRNLQVKESAIQGTSGTLLIWHWYWIDGKLTTNDYLGKLLQAKEKLALRGDDGASVLVFAPYTDRTEDARIILRAFLTAHLSSLEQTLAANRVKLEQAR